MRSQNKQKLMAVFAFLNSNIEIATLNSNAHFSRREEGSGES